MQQFVPLWRKKTLQSITRTNCNIKWDWIGLLGCIKSNIVNVVLLFKQLSKIKILKTSSFSKILKWSIWNPKSWYIYGKKNSIKFFCSRQMSHCGWNSNAPEFLSDHTHFSFIHYGRLIFKKSGQTFQFISYRQMFTWKARATMSLHFGCFTFTDCVCAVG